MIRLLNYVGHEYNLLHNISGFYKVSVQFPFNTSKGELDV